MSMCHKTLREKKSVKTAPIQCFLLANTPIKGEIMGCLLIKTRTGEVDTFTECFVAHRHYTMEFFAF